MPEQLDTPNLSDQPEQVVATTMPGVEIWGFVTLDQEERLRTAGECSEANVPNVYISTARMSAKRNQNSLSSNYSEQRDEGGYGKSRYDGPVIFDDAYSVRATRILRSREKDPALDVETLDPDLISKLLVLAKQEKWSIRARNTLKTLGIEWDEVKE